MKTYHRVMNTNGVRWAGGIFISLFAFAIVAMPHATHAENKRTVTIFHDGAQQTVVTDAATVDEALKRANVTLNDHDAVEPAGSTKLTAPAYDVNVYRAKPVTIIDGASRYEVMSPHTSARQITADAGLTLYNEDTYQLDRIDDFLAEGGVGLKLTINRAVPLRFVLYGKPMLIRTQSKTVGDLLKEKNVDLSDQDGTNIPLTTKITTNIDVEVWRNGVQTTTEEQPVPFTTDFIRDADKPTSYHQVQTPGKNGKKMVTYQVELKNGQIVSRKEIQSVVTEQPQKEVDVIGAQVGFTGAFQEALAKLAGCESGGHYDRNSGNGYYGAYQYDISTWGNFQGYARADLAPPSVQDQKAWETYSRRGWSPWPTCSRKLGLQDIYR